MIISNAVDTDHSCRRATGAPREGGKAGIGKPRGGEGRVDEGAGKEDRG